MERMRKLKKEKVMTGHKNNGEREQKGEKVNARKKGK